MLGINKLRFTFILIAFVPFIAHSKRNCVSGLESYSFESVLELSSARANQILKAAQRGPRLWKDLAPDTDKIKLLYKGYPKSTVKLSEEEVGNLVFRQFRSPETVQKILKEQRLLAGSTPYVFSHSDMQKETYVDMTGIFLTVAGFKDREVGVSYPSYVDVRLPRNTPVLKVEAGIYIIPGPPGIWVPVEILGASVGSSSIN